MDSIIQNILVYLTVIIAVTYLIKKFFFPQYSFTGKKKIASKACGKDGCGCH
ncbi:FeoB-associated Cys-rich membrane protein [Flavobacteriaceae bacterium M23B6Z8]